MQFKNRPNKCVWISRSVAVLAVPFFHCGAKVFVPLGQRSCSLPTEPGKFGLPAGYLDWDETVSEAMIREVWEEIGLDLVKLGEPHRGSISQPRYVFSDPHGDAAQNVTMRFVFSYEVKNLPPLEDSAEAVQVEWFPVEAALGMDLAFNHVEILKEYYV